MCVIFSLRLFLKKPMLDFMQTPLPSKANRKYGSGFH